MQLYIWYSLAGGLLLVSLIIAIVAQIKVSSTYEKYRSVHVKSGVTTSELVDKICRGANMNLAVHTVGGTLTDYYDPSSKSISLSAGNYNSTSISALGVVAHELGHALQDKKNYKPMRIRTAIIKVSNLTSRLLVPLLMVGVLMSILMASQIAGLAVIWCAVGIYFFSFIASLATLPVEFNASNRALKMLGGLEIMDKEELAATKEVLGAAAMTYVASTLISLAYFLRFFLILLSINRRD